MSQADFAGGERFPSFSQTANQDPICDSNRHANCGHNTSALILVLFLSLILILIGEFGDSDIVVSGITEGHTSQIEQNILFAAMGKGKSITFAGSSGDTASKASTFSPSIMCLADLDIILLANLTVLGAVAEDSGDIVGFHINAGQFP